MGYDMLTLISAPPEAKKAVGAATGKKKKKEGKKKKSAAALSQQADSLSATSGSLGELILPADCTS